MDDFVAEKPEVAADPRRARILQGAEKVFLAYGFSRTTMDDIAREAEISRPALYLHFKNKTEIYRAISQTIMDEVIREAKAVLSGDGPLEERLNATVDRTFLAVMRRVGQSPHGPELLDMKNTLAGDQVTDCRARLSVEFAAAFEKEATRTGFNPRAHGLTSRCLAEVLLDGLEGMKIRIKDPDELAAATLGLNKVIALALRA
jgi:AcrR family transcriptional regulator